MESQNKGSQERQGSTLAVRFTEVSVKRESPVFTSMVEEWSQDYREQVHRTNLRTNPASGYGRD